MKTFKSILGIILILFGTITIIQMSSEERGAGLLGALTGYLIILGISVWLLYSANKKEKGNSKKIRTSFFEQNKKTAQKDIEQLSILEQKQSIELLKDKGLLTESEYQEKINIIEDKIALEKLYSSSEYLNLKKLYESEILTNEEFNQKVETIKNKIKTDKKTIDLNNEDDANYENVGIEPIYTTDKDKDGIGWWLLLYLIIPLIGIIMMIVYFSKNENQKGQEALLVSIIGIILNLIMSVIFD